MNKVERIVKSVDKIKKERDDLRKTVIKLEKKISSDLAKNTADIRKLEESINLFTKNEDDRDKAQANLRSSMNAIHNSIIEVIKDQRRLKEEEMGFKQARQDITEKLEGLTEDKTEITEKINELKAASEQQKSMLDLYKARTSDVVNIHENRMNELTSKINEINNSIKAVDQQILDLQESPELDQKLSEFDLFVQKKKKELEVVAYTIEEKQKRFEDELLARLHDNREEAMRSIGEVEENLNADLKELREDTEASNGDLNDKILRLTQEQERKIGEISKTLEQIMELVKAMDTTRRRPVDSFILE